ncbi:MAG: B12-binding domain-containing radical SAM protein [Thermoplasmata archaeon]|nr:MAG: B12-binding domain-containing radical SAM protein [Thermoplasmata archaeon]
MVVCKNMKILFILAHTNMKHTVFDEFVYTYYYPSLTLEQLVAITPNEHDVDVIDGRYQKIDYEWNGDVVGISCNTVSANIAYEIADEFRRRGKTVVLGGWHPSLQPIEAKQHADSVVIGEAEISWPQLLKDYENGKMKPFYQSKTVDPKDIPCPKRKKQKHSLVFTPIQATRGCPYGCKFCPVYKLEGQKLRARPVEQVVEEIKTISSKQLFFVDNSLTINPGYTKKLFYEMKELNKKFTCYGNINVLGGDDELLKLAAEAGCNLWLIGFESVSQETIDDIGKTTNKVKEYENTVKKIHDYGMMVQGLFVFGFDKDTPEIFDKTLNAIYQWRIDKAGFAILTPFPGTTLYEQLEKEGRIITKNWMKYNLKNVVYKPKNMTVEQLFNGTNKLLNEFYSMSNLIRRNIQDEKINFKRFINRTLSEISSRELYKILGY